MSRTIRCILAGVLVCAGLLDSTAVGVPGPCSILVATEESAFKKALLDTVCAWIKEQGLSYRRVGLEDLARESAESYRAILVVQSIRAFRSARPVRDFFREADTLTRQRTILVSTTVLGLKSRESEIQAISAASRKTPVASVAEFVIAGLDSLCSPVAQQEEPSMEHTQERPNHR